MYPWESDETGRETTPRFAAQNASSEIHVNGDVAVAQWQYYLASGDSAWLAREGVRYHELRLRRDGDRRSDTVAKREMVADLDRGHVLFIVEDRTSVVDMWRAEGFVCLQCAPGDF